MSSLKYVFSKNMLRMGIIPLILFALLLSSVNLARAQEETPEPTPTLEGTTEVTEIMPTLESTPEPTLSATTESELSGQGSDPLLGLSAQDAAKVTGQSAEELFLAAQENGEVRLIVGLAVPFTPEGELGAQGAEIQEQAIAAAQSDLLNALAGSNVTHIHSFTYIPYLVVSTDAAGLAQMLSSPLVINVAEDIPVPPALDLSVPRIGANTAWTQGYSGAGRTVAILDTGVDKNHAFLAGRVVSEACYSSDNGYGGTSLCPGGVTSSTAVDSALPYASGVCPSGKCDHGTHVAGIAAGNGVSGGVGFSGVARDANIIAIQVFTRFDSVVQCGIGNSPCALSYYSDQIRGLERVYALRNTYQIDSVNISIGGGKYTAACDSQNPAYTNAINNLRSVGIATVISSGNSGYTDGIAFPGCISSAISVGATTDSDTVAFYSNHASFLTLLAPGSSIYSSIPGGGYQTYDGTSMAAPHVTGAIAILRSKNPALTVDQIVSLLQTYGTAITYAGITKTRISVSGALGNIATPATLSQGYYNENHAALRYSGPWTTWSGSGPTSSTMRYSTVIGSGMSVRFEGIQVALIYAADPSYGTMRIYIDGVQVETLNQYAAALTWNQVWTSGILSPGAHTLSVVHDSGGAVVVDGIRIPAGTGTYDDRFYLIQYTGSWTQSSTSGPYASTLNYSTAIGSQASFEFTGTRLGIVYTRHPSWGTAEISIDGGPWQSINMNGPLAWQQEWISDALTNATHTAVIRHASGTFIDLDAVNVYGPPVEAGTYDDRNGAIRYTGAWVQYNGSGPYLNTFTYTSSAGAAASIRFNLTQPGQGVKVYYTRAPGRGLARIEIDGEFVSYLNQNGTSIGWTSEWSSGPLEAGEHTLVIRQVRGTIDVDKVEVSASALPMQFPATALTTGIYDTANNTNIDFTRGSWIRSSTSGPYASTLNYSDTTGSEVRFRFTGVQLGILYTRHPSWGNVTIAIYDENSNTVQTTTLNMNGAFTWQQEWLSIPLTLGAYSVVIRHDSGTYVDVDAIKVYSN